MEKQTPWSALLKYADYRAEFQDIASAWLGHYAFAYVLMCELRPELMVELGTHRGHSFFSFCQAVAEHDLPTRCFAVDTWRGDAQAGGYGDEIFSEVVLHVQQKYSAFATLLRTDFASAAGDFAANSIDVLHIDGFHTYEAVSSDYAQWEPKVKPGGFILLHDVCERKDDFGVYRLWEEIAPDYAEKYEFSHSHGLGILRKKVGGELSSAVLRTLLLGNGVAAADETAGYLRALSEQGYLHSLLLNYENFNRHLLDRCRQAEAGAKAGEAAVVVAAELRHECDELRQSIARTAEQSAVAAGENCRQRIGELENEVTALRKEADLLRAAQAVRDFENGKLTVQIDEVEQQLLACRNNMSGVQSANAALEREKAVLTAENSRMREEALSLTNSIAVLNGELAVAGERGQTFAARVGELRGELARQCADWEASEAACDDLRGRIAETRAINENLQHRIAAVCEDLAVEKAERARLNDIVEQYKQQEEERNNRRWWRRICCAGK